MSGAASHVGIARTMPMNGANFGESSEDESDMMATFEMRSFRGCSVLSGVVVSGVVETTLTLRCSPSAQVVMNQAPVLESATVEHLGKPVSSGPCSPYFRWYRGTCHSNLNLQNSICRLKASNVPIWTNAI